MLTEQVVTLILTQKENAFVLDNSQEGTANTVKEDTIELVPSAKVNPKMLLFFFNN